MTHVLDSKRCGSWQTAELCSEPHMVYRLSGQLCPNCGVHVSAVNVGARAFDRCPGCQGVWIQQQVFDEMLAEMSADITFSTSCAPATEARLLACCFCSKVMEKGDLFGVILDVCQGHGIWFDGTEIEKTLAAAVGIKPISSRDLADRSLLAEALGFK